MEEIDDVRVVKFKRRRKSATMIEIMDNAAVLVWEEEEDQGR